MALTLLSDPALRAYVDDLRDWHGYVRFLGLPTIQDHPDTPLTDLFVAPQLAAQRVAPETPPDKWPAGRTVFDALSAQKRLVVLGDPGSGKSTIVNWLTWLLAGGAADVLPEAIDGLLPLPIVVRELRLDGVRNFGELIGAFLERPAAARLRSQRGALDAMLGAGRVLLLIDGLDEVPLATRQALRDAIHDGWQRYPELRVLATSRIVGYDECPLEPDGRGPRAGVRVNPIEELTRPSEERDPHMLYVMPFDDARIAAFANQWYRLRSIKPTAEQDANALVLALHRDPNVLELARTPQLLTLMALVYRVRAHLPDGRAMLYDMITEAYLESIDRARLVGAHAAVDRYPWREKRRWLARVGFEMQLLRGAARDQASSAVGRELLVTRSQVLAWIGAAMAASSYPNDDAFAGAYLDWVARRSGLLLPRGEHLFAFVHLSFQEYFAALYLLEHATDADWVIAQRDDRAHADGDGDARVDAAALRAWAQDPLWQEALVFAQEGFAHNPKDARRFAGWLFGDGFADFGAQIEAVEAVKAADPDPAAIALDQPLLARAELLARLLGNPHAGLAAGEREAGVRAVVNFLERRESLFETYGRARGTSGALKRLYESDLARELFLKEVRRRHPQHLNLWNAAVIELAQMEGLEHLETLLVDGIADSTLDPLTKFDGLTYLWLGECPRIESLAPLGSLQRLENLGAYGGKFTDLTPLASLKMLNRLNLWDHPFSDLAPLSELRQLDHLNVSYTKVASIEPLRSNTMLNSLDIRKTPVTDLSPLEGLTALTLLRISPQHLLVPGLAARRAQGSLTVEVHGDDAMQTAT